MKLNSIFLSHKKGTENSETIAMPLPARVKISMSQHMGAPCEPTVAKGDRVLVGQVIGESNAFMSCPVHSSVSGTVAAISELLTAGGKVCKMVEIDTDGEQEVSPDVKPPVITDKASLCEAVRQSGCCGMGGAGFPTHIKLNFDENKYKVDTLVINAAECEPYITSDYREMMENADDVMCGIKLVRDMLGLKKAVIGIEDNKPQAIKLMRSRGFSKRLITRLKRTENGMTRKGVLIRTVDLVYENDIIMINEGDGESLDPNPDLKADILYEDSEVVVFSKPPFMPCHPSIKHRDDTLGNLFAALYPSLAFRPVNRLDRNTSGCVLVAKSQRSAAMLQKSFEKTYVGIIKDLPHCGGRICAPITREQETIIKRCVRADGQYSATDYLVRKRLGDLSLVDFFLETGRTHQIRVHSAFMGYPLLGDDLYGEASPLISRQALHCERMTFQSPENGRIVTVTAPLPEDMLCLMTPDR